jgi:Fe-S-cluster containining protein
MSDTETQQDGPSPWYAKGLKFECTMCGNCCTGPPGAVWFDDAEAESMAGALGISLEVFHRRFTRRINGRQSLRERHTKHGFDCILLDRETQPGRALCRVYRARPTQCRTWPFWSENLEDEPAWQEAKSVTPCPGMGTGTFVPIEEITIRLEKSNEASRRCADPDW